MCGPMNGNLHYYREEFEDTKGIFRIRKSKDRQYNDQKGSLHRIGKCCHVADPTTSHNKLFLIKICCKMYLSCRESGILHEQALISAPTQGQV